MLLTVMSEELVGWCFGVREMELTFSSYDGLTDECDYPSYLYRELRLKMVRLRESRTVAMRRVTTKNQLLVIGLVDLVDVIMGSKGPVVDMNVQKKAQKSNKQVVRNGLIGRLERS
jgi:hypothetical protein